MKTRFAHLACGVALLAFAAGPSRAEDAFNRLRSILIDYFADQGFLPVLIDRDYRIGDVVNVDGVNLYARGTRCFPGLQVGRPIPVVLADVVNSDSAAMSLGLRLRQIFSSSIGADLARRYQIKFTDVTRTAVALLDLRDALDRSACPEIVPLVDGTLGPAKPGEQPYFVVSEILTGKREAKLVFANRADMTVKTQQIAQIAVDAGMSAHGTGDGTVLLASDTIGPIAIKPVTVPQIVKITSFENGLRGSESTDQQRWQPISCQSADECDEQIGVFAERVKKQPLQLSPQDLDR